MLPGLHHVGYWVDDLGSALTRWERDLGVGPFQVIEHMTFESFVLTVGDERYGDIVFDHSTAFAAWSPVVVELSQVHAIDDRLAAAYRVTPGAVSHVSWVVPDVAQAVSYTHLDVYKRTGLDPRRAHRKARSRLAR